ncbi:hypothetical protein VP01_3467g3, partial [Puccinia sorghi]
TLRRPLLKKNTAKKKQILLQINQKQTPILLLLMRMKPNQSKTIPKLLSAQEGWSGSTKNFHKHILKVLELVDLKSSKQIKLNSFQELFRLLNEQAGMLVSQLSHQNILNHLSQVFLQTQENSRLSFLLSRTICPSHKMRHHTGKNLAEIF